MHSSGWSDNWNVLSIKVSEGSCWFLFSGLDGDLSKRKSIHNDDMKCINYKRNNPVSKSVKNTEAATHFDWAINYFFNQQIGYLVAATAEEHVTCWLNQKHCLFFNRRPKDN